MVWLIVFLMLEVVFRAALEIRERRATQLRGGILAVFRVIPVVNDIVPLPENRMEPKEGMFAKAHEDGHKYHRHGVLRNMAKVVMLMLSVSVIAMSIGRYGQPLLIAFLWLHVIAVPARLIFHLYCWNQEYEADRFAFEHVDRKVAKNAMQNLVECEIPYTELFALVYREHPTALMRRKKLLGK